MPLFLIAVVLDLLGLTLLFVGIFANLQVDERFYGDFLIYTGSLIIFLSLGFWIMWYVWNVPVSEDDGLRKSHSVVVKLARKLTERLSQKLKGEEQVKCVEDEDGSQVSAPPAKASRVTWGKSTAYNNEGYDASLDSPTAEDEVEKEEAGNQVI